MITFILHSFYLNTFKYVNYKMELLKSCISKIVNSNKTHIKIDIGLGQYNGQSVNWLSTENNLLVIMFDPNIDSIERSTNTMVRNNIGVNNNNDYHIVPVALSNIDTPSKLNFYRMVEDPGTSSLYKPSDVRLGPVKEISIVDAISLKHFFDIFPWDKFEYIEYIKIDAQGADLDIIKSAGDYLSQKVVYITAEPESNQYFNCEHNSTENIEEYLLSCNFVRIHHPNTLDPTFINKKFMHLKDSIYIYQK